MLNYSTTLLHSDYHFFTSRSKICFSSLTTVSKIYTPFIAPTSDMTIFLPVQFDDYKIKRSVSNLKAGVLSLSLSLTRSLYLTPSFLLYFFLHTNVILFISVKFDVVSYCSEAIRFQRYDDVILLALPFEECRTSAADRADTIRCRVEWKGTRENERLTSLLVASRTLV